MTGLRFRTLCGTLIVLGIAVLVGVDALLFPGTRPLCSLLLVALALLGWVEFARITGIRGQGPKASPGLFGLGLAAVLYFFLLAYGASSGTVGGGSWGDEERWRAGGVFALLFLAFTLVVFHPDHLSRYQAALETIAGALLLGLLFSYLLRIYHLPGWEGPVLGAVLVVGVKGNDTAAYYAGKAWGRHHVFKVSPNKTLEGSLAAIVFSAAYFVIAALVVEACSPGTLFPWSSGILFGMMLSMVSQVGDLGESLVKRVYQVKDSGALLPEFGGALDMIDSLLFTGFLFWAFR